MPRGIVGIVVFAERRRGFFLGPCASVCVQVSSPPCPCVPAGVCSSAGCLRPDSVGFSVSFLPLFNILFSRRGEVLQQTPEQCFRPLSAVWFILKATSQPELGGGLAGDGLTGENETFNQVVSPPVRRRAPSPLIPPPGLSPPAAEHTH